MASDEHKRASERAAALEAERQQLVAEQKRIADDAAIALLKGLDPDLEDDSKVQNVKDLLSEEQLSQLRRRFDERKGSPQPLPITKPPITKPTPEALRDSRCEPTPHPTHPSPPPKMTPPRGIPSTSDSPVPPSGDKILVVDDDPDVLTVLSETLREEGYVVWRANDGVEALKRLFQMPRCDLILLDIMLPRLNGPDFLEILDVSPFSSVPVILISAASRPEGRLVEDDRFVFVKKPLHFEQLLSTVRNRIREGKGWR